MLAQALEPFIGDHTDTNNPFHWYHVQFNLPCTTGYNPRLPCVWLIRFNGELVVRVISLFDDGRVYRLGSERVQSGLRKYFAGLKFIGNQEAERKRTDGGQQPRDWCGCCVYTDHNLPQKLLSNTK